MRLCKNYVVSVMTENKNISATVVNSKMRLGRKEEVT